MRLLDRTTRSVTLADEGWRFYDEVKPHLTAIEDAAAVASGAASAVRGRLKIDIDPFFLPLVLAGPVFKRNLISRLSLNVCRDRDKPQSTLNAPAAFASQEDKPSPGCP